MTPRRRRAHRVLAPLTALVLTLTLLVGSAHAGTRKAPKTLTPTQVWAAVKAAYLKKDFKAMYSHFSAEDRKRTPLAKFAAKARGAYAQKSPAIRASRFLPGKELRKNGRRFFTFGLAMGKRVKRNVGRMVFEGGAWKLYRFR